MCNDYRLEVDIASIVEDFDDLKIKIKMPEGTPNVAARADINISDVAPIVRSGEGRIGRARQSAMELAGQNGRPVYVSAPRAASSLRTAASFRPTVL
jgi:putative SOS response-associated peptidase YedK